MTVTDFLAADGQHFVAMEYYMLLLNRTLLVLLTEQGLLGLKAGGAISVEGGRDPLTRAITRSMAAKGDLNNPYSYVKSSYAATYEQAALIEESLVKLDKANFFLPWSSIKTVTFNPSKKWGMGPYPHDGRVIIAAQDGTKRELIILGDQSGEEVRQQIARKTRLASTLQ